MLILELLNPFAQSVLGNAIPIARKVGSSRNSVGKPRLGIG
jgi:hypothetical protein